MRVFCPNCSEPINIADDLAGKTSTCPLCGSAFTAPTLFSSAPATPSTYGVAAPTPLPTPAPLSSPPAGSSASGPSPNSPTDPVAGGPTSVTASPPSPSAPLPLPPGEDGPSITPLAGRPGAYTKTFGFSIPPEVIQWIAPACLALVVILTLFSWNGAYPGGHGVYTQGPWRALFGRISTDSEGDQVLQLNPKRPAEGQYKLENEVSPNLLMLLYLPLLLGTTVLAFFFTLLPQLSLRVPQNLQQYFPWRMAVVAVLALFVTLLLAIQALRGFGLENALAQRAEAEAKDPLPDRPSSSQEKMHEIKVGVELGKYNVRQTTALSLAFLLQILAAAGAGAAFAMARTDRPAPRIEVMC